MVTAEQDRTAAGARDAGRAGALRAIDRELRREAHVLVGHPELTWQQLYNRLQWESEARELPLAPELARRSSTGARPWLRLSDPIP